MTNVTPLKKPQKTCRYGFTAEEAREKIEALRGDDSCIKHDPHLFKQAAMRCVTLHQVMIALARGREVGPPELHKDSNCWRMVYRDFVAGDDISVVAELEKLKMGEYLLTVTVIHHGSAPE